jgi:hypothetical protein
VSRTQYRTQFRSDWDGEMNTDAPTFRSVKLWRLCRSAKWRARYTACVSSILVGISAAVEADCSLRARLRGPFSGFLF